MSHDTVITMVRIDDEPKHHSPELSTTPPRKNSAENSKRTVRKRVVPIGGEIFKLKPDYYSSAIKSFQGDLEGCFQDRYTTTKWPRRITKLFSIATDETKDHEMQFKSINEEIAMWDDMAKDKLIEDLVRNFLELLKVKYVSHLLPPTPVPPRAELSRKESNSSLSSAGSPPKEAASLNNSFDSSWSDKSELSSRTPSPKLEPKPEPVAEPLVATSNNTPPVILEAELHLAADTVISVMPAGVLVEKAEAIQPIIERAITPPVVDAPIVPPAELVELIAEKPLSPRIAALESPKTPTPALEISGQKCSERTDETKKITAEINKLEENIIDIEGDIRHQSNLLDSKKIDVNDAQALLDKKCQSSLNDIDKIKKALKRSFESTYGSGILHDDKLIIDVSSAAKRWWDKIPLIRSIPPIKKAYEKRVISLTNAINEYDTETNKLNEVANIIKNKSIPLSEFIKKIGNAENVGLQERLGEVLYEKLGLLSVSGRANDLISIQKGYDSCQNAISKLTATLVGKKQQLAESKLILAELKLKAERPNTSQLSPAI
jgi:hypothetical protein